MQHPIPGILLTTGLGSDSIPGIACEADECIEGPINGIPGPSFRLPALHFGGLMLAVHEDVAVGLGAAHMALGITGQCDTTSIWATHDPEVAGAAAWLGRAGGSLAIHLIPALRRFCALGFYVQGRPVIWDVANSTGANYRLNPGSRGGLAAATCNLLREVPGFCVGDLAEAIAVAIFTAWGCFVPAPAGAGISTRGFADSKGGVIWPLGVIQRRAAGVLPHSSPPLTRSLQRFRLCSYHLDG